MTIPKIKNMATVKRFHNYHIKSVKICLKEELFKNGTAFLQDRFHFLFQDAFGPHTPAPEVTTL